MVECYKCGLDFPISSLYDIISKEGINKVCENCLMEEDSPVIRAPTTFQLKAAEQPSTAYERLSRMAGLNPMEHVSKFRPADARKMEAAKTQGQEVSLKDLIDKNYKSRLVHPASVERREDLIDNFHWVIMMGRRSKKLSTEQVAKGIEESKTAIEMMERGTPPGDYDRLARKLEAFLGIKILKSSDSAKKGNIEIKKTLSFDKDTVKNLTIANLKEMSKNKDEIEEEIEIEEEDLDEKE